MRALPRGPYCCFAASEFVVKFGLVAAAGGFMTSGYCSSSRQVGSLWQFGFPRQPGRMRCPLVGNAHTRLLRSRHGRSTGTRNGGGTLSTLPMTSVHPLQYKWLQNLLTGSDYYEIGGTKYD